MWWNYKYCLLSAFLLLSFPFKSVACGLLSPADTTAEVWQADKSERYERRAARFMQFWHSLTPRRVVVQYAGGIGLVSAGLGWVYGAHNSWETDFMLGYVPPYTTGRGKLTITTRETYVPFDFKLYDAIRMQPLAVAMYFNVITGHEFWMSEPARYPHKYYGFSSGIRSGISLGQRLHLRIPVEKRRRFNDVMLYYDFNACDIDIVSFASNHSVSLWNIVNISLGVKLTVF